MKHRPMIQRAVPLIDLSVDTSKRTVTAYAATFNEPYAVRDEYGDYDEEIDQRAFNRAISHGISRVGVFFNHGLTLFGTPSEQFSKPLGSPVEIRAEKRGLLTVTRYNRTPLADEVLEMIDNGDVKAQSFRGAIVQTAPPKIRNGRQLIRRLELGLKEYGPAPFPANTSAEILTVRSTIAGRLRPAFSEEQIVSILEALGDDPIDLDALVADIGAGASSPTGHDNTQSQPADEAPVEPGSSVELAAAALASLRARHP